MIATVDLKGWFLFELIESDAWSFHCFDYIANNLNCMIITKMKIKDIFKTRWKMNINSFGIPVIVFKFLRQILYLSMHM